MTSSDLRGLTSQRTPLFGKTVVTTTGLPIRAFKAKPDEDAVTSQNQISDGGTVGSTQRRAGQVKRRRRSIRAGNAKSS
jgi:hypothetical protein